jgi:hypothetical protein
MQTYGNYSSSKTKQFPAHDVRICGNNASSEKYAEVFLELKLYFI